MKNKKLKAIAGLVAVAVIGGSLAYFNQTMTVENPFVQISIHQNSWKHLIREMVMTGSREQL